MFGSVLPDIATTSKGGIGRDKIHYAPKEFYQFASEKFPELLDLAIGVRLHSNIGKGADFYSDDTETGYAKVNGREISSDVARLLEIEDGPVSLVLAHNFIETGIDLNLRYSHPEILDIYRKGMGEIIFSPIVTCLSEYLGNGSDEVKEELLNLANFLSPDHLVSLEDAVGAIVLPLIELKFQKKVDPGLALKIAQKAVDIAKPTYLQFLDKTVQQIKLDFSEFTTVDSLR